MNPKDLEFTAALIGNWGYGDYAARRLAKLINDELRERLGKAQIVYGFKGVQYTVWHPHPVGGDHSIARLVYVEELKK